jgi:hypothetical protein
MKRLLNGKKVVFTGFRNDGLKQTIEKAGGQVMTAVSSLTDIVVWDGEKGRQSDKIVKAKLLNVQVMSKVDFMKRFTGTTLLDVGKIEKGKHGAERKYFIHDNGSRPFKVTLTKSHFWIHKMTVDGDGVDTKETIRYDAIVLKPTQYENAWIGKCKSCGKGFDGNSILVKLTAPTRTYMSIGDRVYTFKTADDIVQYESPVGNSDVPYPYAVGSKNTYLMLENMFIPNDMRTTDDPYEQYYCRDKGQEPNKCSRWWATHLKSHRMMNMKIVHERL